MPRGSSARASRILDLDGAVNFRDLGGYRAGDGRRVRRGKVFRSDHLGALSDADLSRLQALGLRCICDLRSERERLNLPDRIPASDSIRVVHLEIDQAALLSPELAERVYRPGATAEDFAQAMRESYRRMVSHCAAQFAALLRLLDDPANLPLLVHCTGGKDRSGFAAAIVMVALGVPMRTVTRDYLLTNRALDAERKPRSARASHSLYPPRIEGPLAPLFVADRAYLGESFAEIERLYGSFDHYLRAGLDFSDQQRAALQERLLG